MSNNYDMFIDGESIGSCYFDDEEFTVFRERTKPMINKSLNLSVSISAKLIEMSESVYRDLLGWKIKCKWNPFTGLSMKWSPDGVV